MKILFVTEKWCDGKPECGETNTYHNLFNTAAIAGHSYKNVFFDQYSRERNRKHIHQAIRDEAVGCDLVVFTPLNIEGSPMPESFAEIQGIKKAIVFWDSVGNPSKVNESIGYFDFGIVMDSTDTCKGHANDRKILYTFTPQDTDIYQDDGLERDIDICFVGSVKRREGRSNAINEARNAGLTVVVAGGQRENRLSVDEYARYLKRSKISLNCSHALGRVQMTGRAFESMHCGALLMESPNYHLGKYFVKGKDYVEFKSSGEFAQKAKALLENPLELSRIASAGNKKVVNNYNATTFWQGVEEKMASV